jgi:hypothetical protein
MRLNDVDFWRTVFEHIFEEKEEEDCSWFIDPQQRGGDSILGTRHLLED